MTYRYTMLYSFCCLICNFANAQVELTVAIVPDESDAIVVSEKSKTKLELVVFVANHTPDSVDIPTNYSPDVVRLCASGSNNTKWPLVLFQRSEQKKREIKLKKLGPKQTHEILRANVRNVFLNPGNIYSLNPTKEFAVDRWTWGWRAHPGPDYSPFERRKGDRRSSTAVIWCELDLKGQKIRSVPLLIQSDWKDEKK